MALPDIFSKAVSDSFIARINQLTPDSKPLWGKMDVTQMLAHCNVTYEYVFEPDKHKPAGAIMKFFLKNFVKSKVVSDKAYPKNNPTGPDFIIKDNRDFSKEKERLIGFIKKSQELGADYFVKIPSHSFGYLTATEWNNMFYKHLEHHLAQFGV